ncbi:MAG: thiosulfate sulfurtransferase [Leptospiraceae bacterium]|nr:thiosulfate sulfurtransferase [Leptospiraceae bacterium]MCP5499007.1 thiosulfate sulfurtransferase [Leptospiraceae bacterium]
MLNWNFLKTEIEADDFLIDCKSQASYEQETIENAYYFPFIKKALGSDPDSQKKLYFPLVKILDLVEETKKNRIIVFDEGMGMFAARMVYLLRCIGFKESYIFSGKWPLEGVKIAEGKQILEFEIPPKEKAKPIKGVVDKAFMEKNLTRLQIFDARTKDEYEGLKPRMTNPEEGTLCGRLPGAFLWDWRSLYAEGGNLIEKPFFIRKLQSFPFMPERTTVVYDYNGARSCLHALMLKEVGYQEVYTYQGSWFEWRKSNLPKQAVSIFGQGKTSTSAPRLGGLNRK